MPTFSSREFVTISMYMSAIFGGLNRRDLDTILSAARWLLTRASVSA